MSGAMKTIWLWDQNRDGMCRIGEMLGNAVLRSVIGSKEMRWMKREVEVVNWMLRVFLIG